MVVQELGWDEDADEDLRDSVVDVSGGEIFGFILLLGIMMIAAPGVPGGAIMAAAGLLQSNLGFDDSMLSLMIASYIVVDSFRTAVAAAVLRASASGSPRGSDSTSTTSSCRPPGT